MTRPDSLYLDCAPPSVLTPPDYRLHQTKPAFNGNECS